jgi:uncharacterized low-complexity protein
VLDLDALEAPFDPLAVVPAAVDPRVPYWQVAGPFVDPFAQLELGRMELGRMELGRMVKPGLVQSLEQLELAQLELGHMVELGHSESNQVDHGQAEFGTQPGDTSAGQGKCGDTSEPGDTFECGNTLAGQGKCGDTSAGGNTLVGYTDCCMQADHTLVEPLELPQPQVQVQVWRPLVVT